MSQEKEAIRQEMDETRSSLTDKINLLEERVVETVHYASNGVKETIEKVKEAVGDSVDKVRESVGDTVDSVKETFSVRVQVRRRPWLMVAGSVGVGFMTGYLLNSPTRSDAKTSPVRPTRRVGNGSYREPAPLRSNFAEEPTADQSSGVVEQLTKTFEKEINQIKGLAIGTLAGIVRDLVVTTVPDMMKNPIHEVFNDVTTKLGGQAIPGRILSEDWHFKSEVPEDEPTKHQPYSHPRQTSFMQ